MSILSNLHVHAKDRRYVVNDYGTGDEYVVGAAEAQRIINANIHELRRVQGVSRKGRIFGNCNRISWYGEHGRVVAMTPASKSKGAAFRLSTTPNA